MAPTLRRAGRRVAIPHARLTVTRLLVVDAGLGLLLGALVAGIPLLGSASTGQPERAPSVLLLEPTDTTSVVTSTDPSTSTPPSSTPPSSTPPSSTPPSSTSQPPSTTSRPPGTSPPPPSGTGTLGLPPSWPHTAAPSSGGTSSGVVITGTEFSSTLDPEFLLTGLIETDTGPTGTTSLSKGIESVLPTVSVRPEPSSVSTTSAARVTPSDDSLASTIGWGSLVGGLVIGAVGLGSLVVVTLSAEAKHRG